MKEFFETKKGILILNALKYLMFFACEYLFCIGGIRGQIFPFAFGFFVALCWCEQNLLAMGAIYVLANLIAHFSVANIIQSAFCAVFVLICFFAHKKAGKRIPLWLLAIYAVASQAVYLYFSLVGIEQIVSCLVYLVLGLLFMFSAINIFKTLLVKGIGLKLTIDENICLCAFFVALGAGLASANVFGFSVLNVVAVFLIMLCTFVFSSASVPLVVAVSLGLGYALQCGLLAMVASLALLAVCAISFKSTNKYFCLMAILLGDIMLGLYFNAYEVYTYKILLSTVLGEILFLCVSNGTIAFLKSLFAEHSNAVALKNMVNRSKDNLFKRMYSLSEVFDEMCRSFKSTIKGTLPASDAKQMLKEELMNKVCYDCPEKHRCHRVLAKETNETFDFILSSGLDKGKVTLLDIPPFLSARCNRSNIILGTLNQLLASYKQYTTCINNVDTSKALVAEEFKGVSKLLQKLAEETNQLVTFDDAFEQKLAEEFEYAGILATEVYVYQKNGKSISCTVTVRSSDLENQNLYQTLDRVFGVKMALYSSQQSGTAGYSIATFSPAPKFECIYGSCGATKFGSEVSGDSYLAIRLGGKMLFAVCDGMGSGESAQKISDTTISLIEDFYRAEFDDETILSSVNKLLTMQMSDNYCALDVFVLDLSNALADFIKVGAPASILKHKDGSEILSGSGALPIGILDEIKPSIDKKVLSINDIVILASDGILDAFESAEALQNFVCAQTSTNPQELADFICKRAIELNSGEPQDDMTVLCVRMYANV